MQLKKRINTKSGNNRMNYEPTVIYRMKIMLIKRVQKEFKDFKYYYFLI